MAHRDSIVTVDAADIGDQVDLLNQVEAGTRRCDEPPFGGRLGVHAETCEDVEDGLLRQRESEHLSDTRMAQRQRPRLGSIGLRDRLDHRTRLAADDRDQEPGRALDRADLELGIDTALEAMRRIRMQTVRACLAADGQRREEGALEQHIAGLGTDRGLRTAHDAGQRDGAPGIGDHQGVRAQGRFLAVEQGNTLAFGRHAHADLAVELGEIKPVHRLTQLEQDIVGHVDHRADGADPAAAQALLHPPRRRRARIDVADHAAHIARAGCRGLEMHRQGLVMEGCDRLDRGCRERRTVDHGDLACESGHAQTIASIRGEIHLDAVVVQRHPAADILAYRGIRRQRQDTLGGLGKTQLLGRADHAEGLHAPQLGLLDLEVAGQHGADGRDRDLHPLGDVGGPADDLDRRVLAEIHPTDPQLLGIRMRCDGLHPADPHAAEGRGRGFDCVDLETRHAELVGQVPGVDRWVHPLPQPRLAESHLLLPYMLVLIPFEATRIDFLSID